MLRWTDHVGTHGCFPIERGCQILPNNSGRECVDKNKNKDTSTSYIVASTD